MVKKIVPLREDFESLDAILASIAEDPEAVGFAAVVKKSDGTMHPVTFGITVAEMSHAGAVFLGEAAKS